MTNKDYKYPIGTPGLSWTQKECSIWLSQQKIKRSYKQEVLDRYVGGLDMFKMHQYGALPIDSERYPLFSFVTINYDHNKPSVLITGGVHGYETSGVQGAISFMLDYAHQYIDDFNFVIVPCVSPWGYETINRWNSEAIDPNRSFYASSQCYEAEALLDYVDSLDLDFDAHIDLHETTDTDNSEFRPALAARDGITLPVWGIPDGFYLVADESDPQVSFQQTIINEVRKVTHIAPADNNNQIIGCDCITEGVICYDKSELNLCGGMTNSPYRTTTEVYPDSPNVTSELCNLAQVAAITGLLTFLLGETQ